MFWKGHPKTKAMQTQINNETNKQITTTMELRPGLSMMASTMDADPPDKGPPLLLMFGMVYPGRSAEF